MSHDPALCGLLPSKGPLVRTAAILLAGLVDRPYIPICIVVAITTPITFYLYGMMAKVGANVQHMGPLAGLGCCMHAQDDAKLQVCDLAGLAMSSWCTCIRKMGGRWLTDLESCANTDAGPHQ